MKKNIFKLLFCVVIITCIVIFFSINVTTQQGINYQVHTIRIPLYLKILDFTDRHFNYKQLVKKIIKEAKTDEECVMKIFEWTYKNIRKNPKSLAVIDDHVWHIIVRGYGKADQFQDVFSTLCNYAGLDAFFLVASKRDQTKKIPLSLVKIEEKWYVFDAYRGVYFEDIKGELADIETIKSKNIKTITITDKEPEIDYTLYLDDLPLLKEMELERSNIQSPIRRFIYELKKWLRCKK